LSAASNFAVTSRSLSVASVSTVRAMPAICGVRIKPVPAWRQFSFAATPISRAERGAALASARTIINDFMQSPRVSASGMCQQHREDKQAPSDDPPLGFSLGLSA
jgi:hypothetical protein